MRGARKLVLNYLVGFMMLSSWSVTCAKDTVGRGGVFSESSTHSRVASPLHAAGRLSIRGVSGSKIDIRADSVEGRMPRTVSGENTA